MAESGFKGKSMKIVAMDVAEGYISVNPLFLKKFDMEMTKNFYDHLNKTLIGTRNDKIDFTNQAALRVRNMRLQRLHNAMIVLRNIARQKGIPL